MKYCVKCGNSLDNDAKFCNKCGQQVNNDSKDMYTTKLNTEKIDAEKINTEKISLKKVNDIKPNNLNNNVENTFVIDKDKIDLNKDKLDLNKGNKDVNKSYENSIKDNIPSNNNENIIKNNERRIKSSNLDRRIMEEPIREEKGNKALIVVGIILGLIIVISAVLFIFRKDIAYTHFMKKSNTETSETSKLVCYNKALKYKYTQEVLDNVYEVVRKNDDFSERISNVSNLKKEDAKKLIKDSAIFRAKSNFDSGNYKACMENLQKAQKVGYNINSFGDYKELVEKLNPQENTQPNTANVSNNYTYKNDHPSIANKVVNSLGNVYCKDHKGYEGVQGYIVPDSDSRYLSEAELQQYDKYTLGLIRNEIYARHGYIFGDNRYRDYFSKKNWYVPDPSFHGDDAEINDYEYYNGRLILEIEKTK
ncbi:hypothetical protein Z969_01575 [Clostridium novyi A str. 4570]|uniref:YARHG domain-containing protein n=1 Tax=Clostridium novyi A str. 4570 TaxID=1444290 RepID=A0AA88ZRZ8_CLONO|nr:YARHG domain-containing protein [Clostridium novyi]KGN03311.1 hypothetical protein Z969_01575 [Clostridium novyi A str. 4570]